LTPKSDQKAVTISVTIEPRRNMLRNTVTSRNSVLRNRATIGNHAKKSVTISERNCYANMFVTRPRFLSGADCYGVTAASI
jgi:hypothetical protein